MDGWNTAQVIDKYWVLWENDNGERICGMCVSQTWVLQLHIFNIRMPIHTFGICTKMRVDKSITYVSGKVSLPYPYPLYPLFFYCHSFLCSYVMERNHVSLTWEDWLEGVTRESLMVLPYSIHIIEVYPQIGGGSSLKGRAKWVWLTIHWVLNSYSMHAGLPCRKQFFNFKTFIMQVNTQCIQNEKAIIQI